MENRTGDRGKKKNSRTVARFGMPSSRKQMQGFLVDSRAPILTIRQNNDIDLLRYCSKETIFFQ
jgi:hypothetical protein